MTGSIQIFEKNFLSQNKDKLPDMTDWHMSYINVVIESSFWSARDFSRPVF